MYKIREVVDITTGHPITTDKPITHRNQRRVTVNQRAKDATTDEGAREVTEGDEK
ncbi:hypothetical protein J3D43_002653 [Paenibacillus xylanexedens]|uniref:hypothetical protein n=1 Tax=Paenibacillus xylanexedens TaxID=528191 RepID=UPI0020A1AC32|nr:hypothetical protein [Paenibacillus xylanexedens]MCP1424137.1 hypothetical protein [Paenibacillus xylanexedens]